MNIKFFFLLIDCFQWAKIVIVLERGISKKKLLEYQKSYSVKLSGKPPPDDGCPPAVEERALVVIKNCEKSKAKTRKGAVHRWKVAHFLLLNFFCFSTII